MTNLWLVGSIFGGAAFIVGASLLDAYQRFKQDPPPQRLFDVDESTKNRGLVIKALRWFTAPVCAVGASWLLALDAQGVTDAVPSLFSSYSNRIKAVMPLHPSNLREAFDLGVAYEMLKKGGASEALKIAQEIAGRVVNEAELRNIVQVINDIMAEKGIVDRMLSAFTLVNVVWFIAIIGLTATVGPFLYYILSPLRGILYKVSVWLYDKVCKGFLYGKYLWEPVLYAMSYYLLVEGARYTLTNADPYALTGVMTTCSGIGVYALAWAYTTGINATGGGDFETFMVLSWSLAAGYVAPQAVLHQSKLLGYLATAAVCFALKFTAFSTGLCTAVGFRNFRHLFTAAIGCGSLTIINFALKASGVESHWLRPFQSPVGVLGTSVYLLCLDILAFLDRSPKSYIFYVINLVGYIVAGELLGMPGPSNVAKTYVGLLMLTLYGNAFPKNGGAAIVWVFFLFAILYAGSLFLSRNPQYLAAVFSGGVE